MDSIRIKRGLSKDLPTNLPLGELAFCTDTQELWVGTGSSTPLKKVKDLELEKNLEQTNAQLSHIEIMRPYVNVKEFGAKGDGITDDTNAFVNALKNNVTVEVPKGVYVVNDLSLNAKNRLIGSGSDSTILKGNVILPLSSHLSEIKNLKILATDKDVGINVGYGGSLQVQDFSCLIENVRISGAGIGLKVGGGVRGSLFNHVIVGDCDTGYDITGTDNEFISCIAAVIKYHGFKTTSPNNRYTSCKAFCCGNSKSYGSGFLCKGSFNIIKACEFQQNRFENLVLYNANGCLIECISDGAGWGSGDDMSYNHPEFGTIPISSVMLHNTRNSNIKVSIINGRTVDGSVWKCATGIYSKYPKTCVENILEVNTKTIIDNFTDYNVGDFERFVASNKVTINNTQCNIFYGNTFNFFGGINNGVRDKETTLVCNASTMNTVVKAFKMPSSSHKISGYIKDINFSNRDNSSLSVTVQVVGKDSSGSTKYLDLPETSLMDSNLFAYDLSTKTSQLQEVNSIILRFLLRPKSVSDETLNVIMKSPTINTYF